jgi:RHS repeat-associated protein
VTRSPTPKNGDERVFGTLIYTYDAAGNVASIISSNTMGINVSYTYDDMGRLETVVDNRLTGNNTTTYTYDAGSNLKTAAYPNYPSNVSSAYAYDTLNRLTGLSTPVSSYSYQLGATGNRKSVTEGTGRAINWTYDNIYRLTNETISADPANKDGVVGYSLDPVGNRKQTTSSLSGVTPGSWTYNTDDELTTDSYDNNGNTTHSGANSYVFDSQNHLMSMNGTVTMVYDGDGNRVAKTVGVVTTHYLVDDLNPTGEAQVVDELVSGAVVRQYTYGLERISENQWVNNTWVPSFYGYDGSGSVRQLTSYATGQITDTYDYDAFGNKVNSTGTTPNNYLYRGEQYDPDLGLYYLRARYYNPVTGRFLNVDPMAGDGQRRYEFAAADPVNGMDPSGNFVLESYRPLCCAQMIPVPAPPPCESRASGPMGSSLPPCGPKRHLVLDRTTFEPKVEGLHVIWTLRFNDGSAPDGNYYVMEQQQVKWLAHRQDGSVSPSGRSFDFPNKFDDSIQTFIGYDPVDSLQSFQISLSHPNYDGWAANAMHVPIRIGETEYCGDSIHLVWGGSTQLGATCKGAQ